MTSNKRKSNKTSKQKQGGTTKKKESKEKKKEIKKEKEEEETLWNVFRNHFLIRIVLPFLVLPYCLYRSYSIVLLRYTHFIPSIYLTWWDLRLPKQIEDERQTLILGLPTFASERSTQQRLQDWTAMTRTVRHLFGVEWGIQTTDTTHQFVRDGTLSTFSFVRFLSTTKEEEEADPQQEQKKKNQQHYMIQTVMDLCMSTNVTDKNDIWSVIGFHPRHFDQSIQCNGNPIHHWLTSNSPTFAKFLGSSSSLSPSACWSRECLIRYHKEWGCQTNTDNNNNNNDQQQLHIPQKCETPFHTVLFQLQNPWTLFQNWANHFCQSGATKKSNKDDVVVVWDTTLPTHVKTVLKAWFGNNLAQSKHENDYNLESFSCLEGVTHFIVEYYKTLLQLQQSNSFRSFKMEDTTPCHVMELAGFTTSSKTHASISKRIQRYCGNNKDDIPPPPDGTFTVDMTTNSAAPSVLERIENALFSQQYISKSEAAQHTITERLAMDESTDTMPIILSWQDLEGGRHGSQRPKDDTSLIIKMKSIMTVLGYSIHDIPLKPALLSTTTTDGSSSHAQDEF